jgi:hypothetical protein
MAKPRAEERDAGNRAVSLSSSNSSLSYSRRADIVTPQRVPPSHRAVVSAHRRGRRAHLAAPSPFAIRGGPPSPHRAEALSSRGKPLATRSAYRLANSGIGQRSHGIESAAPAAAHAPRAAQQCMLELRGARHSSTLGAGLPSNGVDFAASPSHAPLELEQQDCMLELGEGQGTSLEQEVRGPATAPPHDP